MNLSSYSEVDPRVILAFQKAGDVIHPSMLDVFDYPTTALLSFVIDTSEITASGIAEPERVVRAIADSARDASTAHIETLRTEVPREAGSYRPLNPTEIGQYRQGWRMDVRDVTSFAFSEIARAQPHMTKNQVNSHPTIIVLNALQNRI